VAPQLNNEPGRRVQRLPGSSQNDRDLSPGCKDFSRTFASSHLSPYRLSDGVFCLSLGNACGWDDISEDCGHGGGNASKRNAKIAKNGRTAKICQKSPGRWDSTHRRSRADAVAEEGWTVLGVTQPSIVGKLSKMAELPKFIKTTKNIRTDKICKKSPGRWDSTHRRSRAIQPTV
jgi:hypothetical protein